MRPSSTVPPSVHLHGYCPRSIQPQISVIVPTLNEARNLEAVLPELPADYELVLVDGGSVDDTVTTALRLRPDCLVVRQTGRGKGNALLCGFASASGDILVTLDADGSADPREIPLPDPDSARPDRMLWGDGFEIETLLSCRAIIARLRLAEVPSVERARIRGASKLRTFIDGARVLRTLLVENRRARARARGAAARVSAGTVVRGPSADACQQPIDHSWETLYAGQQCPAHTVKTAMS